MAARITPQPRARRAFEYRFLFVKAGDSRVWSREARPSSNVFVRATHGGIMLAASSMHHELPPDGSFSDEWDVQLSTLNLECVIDEGNDEFPWLHLLTNLRTCLLVGDHYETPQRGGFFVEPTPRCPGCQREQPIQRHAVRFGQMPCRVHVPYRQNAYLRLQLDTNPIPIAFLAVTARGTMSERVQ